MKTTIFKITRTIKVNIIIIILIDIQDVIKKEQRLDNKIIRAYESGTK